MEHIVNSLRGPGGVRLEYVEHGAREGVPVVMLHGLSDSWRSFADVVPLLPRHLRAIAVSQRGHGDSDRPVTGYRARDFAADVAELMTGLGIDRAVIVGHCMGAYVAQRLALDHPERVLGLVLAGTRSDWRTHAGVMELCDYVRNSMSDPVDPGFVTEFQRSTIRRPVPAARFDTIVAESLKVPARVWRAVCDDCLLAPGTTAELAQVGVPALLLCGLADEIALDAQLGLAAAIKGARLVIYQDSGHSLHWEEPDRFAADVASFVAGLTGREAAAAAPARAVA